MKTPTATHAESIVACALVAGALCMAGAMGHIEWTATSQEIENERAAQRSALAHLEFIAERAQHLAHAPAAPGALDTARELIVHLGQLPREDWSYRKVRASGKHLGEWLAHLDRQLRDDDTRTTVTAHARDALAAEARRFADTAREAFAAPAPDAPWNHEETALALASVTLPSVLGAIAGALLGGGLAAAFLRLSRRARHTSQ